ncbi:hypothetical protein GMI70_08900 [Eggerthellaceae bacterium zg-893]|nr:hypothetical protein [Eggerthellaceae bacterium zg-893]
MSKIKPLASKTYGGGGKVLSVILAGTLALGMTPAAALSQAALDVTPAYAGETVAAQSLTTWDGFNASGASEIRLTAVPATSFTYDGESHVLSTTDFAVQLVVVGGDAAGTYTLANGAAEGVEALYEVTSVTGPDSSPILEKSVENGGIYTVKITATDGAPKVNVGTGAYDAQGVNPSVDTPLTVAPYLLGTSPVTPANAVVGVTTGKKLVEATLATAGKTSFGADIKGLLDVKYLESTTNQDEPAYNEAGEVGVTVKVQDEDKSNYAFAEDATPGSYVQTLNKKAQAEVKGTYNLVFGTADQGIVANPVFSKTGNFPVSSLPDMAVTTMFPGDNPGDPDVEKAIPAAAYENGVVWKKNDVAADPVFPGVYTGSAQIGGANGKQANNTISLKIVGQLGDVTNDAKTQISATVGGQSVSDTVKIAGAATKEAIEQQILDALEVTLSDGKSEPTKMVVPQEYLKVSVSGTATSGTAVVTATEAAAGLYEGSFNIAYEFGQAFPKAEPTFEGGELPYFGTTGYNFETLVKFVDDKGEAFTSSSFTESDYEVKITRKGADGKFVDADSIKDVGEYNIAVTPKGTTYFGAVQNIGVTITPVKVTTANSTATWDGLTGASTNYTTVFTGSEVTPLPTYTVNLVDPFNEDADPEPFKVDVVKKADDTPADATVVTYQNNRNAGDATATVEFNGNFTGELSTNFEITQANIANASVSAQSQLYVEGADVTVEKPIVTYGEATLVEGEDYTVDPKSITKQAESDGVATYSFAVEGMGNYTGTKTGTFKVTNKDIAKLWAITVDDGPHFYAMGDKVPASLTIKAADAAGESDPALYKDVTASDPDGAFIVEYANDTQAGTATVTVTGTGDYAGSQTLTYDIQALELSDASNVDGSVKLGGADNLVYTGKQQVPRVLTDSELTPVNEGYEGNAISYMDFWNEMTAAPESDESGINAGTSYLVLTPTTGNFVGSVKVPYEIAPAELTADNVSVEGSVAPGAPASDAVKVTFGDAILAADVDYTVDPEGELPGKATVTVSGKGNFAGTVVKEDVEVLYDLQKASVTVEPAVYNGEAQDPKVEVSYTAGGEKVVVPADAYTVTGADGATNAGAYKVTVTGKENEGWTKSVDKDFVIDPVAGPKTAEVTYTAAGAYKVTVPGLVEGVDFTVTPNPAQKKLVITYTGNYTGTATVSYDPAPAPAPAPAKDGWVGSGDDWAYYEGGKQVKNQWKFIDNAWYHFEANGQMTNTQWFQDADGEWYLFDQSHKGSYGAMLTGWQFVDGGWYYLNKSGAMQSGWMKDTDGTWYLLNSKHDGTFGKMLTGWQLVGGKWYYLDKSGAMAENEWVGPYWVNASGVWTATR